MRLFPGAVVAAALVAGAGLAAGCGGEKAEQKAAEKAVERAIEKQTGGKAEVEIGSGSIRITTKEGRVEYAAGEERWPDDLPGEVPKLEGAKVTGVNRVTEGARQTWMIGLENVGSAAFRGYVDGLKKEGWSIGVITTTEDGQMVQAAREALTLVASYDGGDGAAVLQVHRGDE